MFDLKRFAAVVPTSEPALRRLNHLLRTGGEPPRIAVLGKYNHGKSSLLNALVGTDHFSVADKRETVRVYEYEHDGVVWIDTPGLDVDPKKGDDRRAQDAAVEIGDFLFLVHRADEGELDRYEINAFSALAKQDRNYRQKMVLVLTQIDQADRGELDEVEERCRQQLQENLDLRELDIMSVSARRHRNPNLRTGSGMEDVFARVERWKTDTLGLRRRERARLTAKVLRELEENRQDTEAELKAARHRLKTDQRSLQSAAETIVRELQEE